MPKALISAYLNLDYVRSVKWSSEFSGADGRTDEQHNTHNNPGDKIMKLFFDVYKPVSSPPHFHLQQADHLRHRRQACRRSAASGVAAAVATAPNVSPTTPSSHSPSSSTRQLWR
jgi:hypothetical protein